MQPPAIPDNEAQRLAALRALNVLDTPPEERFDCITRIAARLMDVPICLVSLVDANRQWFKSCVGLAARETPRDISFCGHAILESEALVIPDALAAPRFADNPLVAGEPRIRFYAGQPLSAVDGSRLGTLCLIDRKPRHMSAADLQALRDLAHMVERELASKARTACARRPACTVPSSTVPTTPSFPRTSMAL
jgi:GAF domain-containing protein